MPHQACIGLALYTEPSGQTAHDNSHAERRRKRSNVTYKGAEWIYMEIRRSVMQRSRFHKPVCVCVHSGPIRATDYTRQRLNDQSRLVNYMSQFCRVPPRWPRDFPTSIRKSWQ
jgi:hypothetical protein